MKKLAKILCLVTILVLSLVVATACETLENHEHKLAAEWLSDGTNHYHACTFEGCTEKLDSAPCSGGKATCQAKAVCSVCGAEYGQLGAHVYNKEVATDAYLATPASHSAAATYYKSCECGAKGTETFSSGSAIAHVFDKEVATDTYKKESATCTTAAVYYKSCECGAKGTATFEHGEALGHNWVDDEDNSTPASWTEAGVHAEKCDRTNCIETRTTPIECLARTLIIENADEVPATWDVKKYDSDWVSTSATATKTENASHDETNATTFKIWHNSTAFRFSTSFDAQGKDYNLIVADIKGDGVAKVSIRLRNSQSGIYATYKLPVALASGWYHYELSLADDDWIFTGVTDAAAKRFDIIEFIFQTTTSNGAQSTVVIDNVAIKNVQNPETAISSLASPTPVAPTAPLLKLDFEDGAGSGAYTNAAWTQEKYAQVSGTSNYDWQAMSSSQMNSRSKDGSKVVNFVSYGNQSRRFTYTIGSTLASVNYVSIDLGNYFEGAANIKYKVVLIDSNGTSHYVGGSSDWLTLAPTSGLTTLDYTFTTAVSNVVAVRIVTQGTVNSNQYMYADNIILDLVS